MSDPEEPSLEGMIRSLFHDIRNPLAVMNNSLYFVKTKLGANVDPKVTKHVAILEAEIQRANDILTQALSFFKEPELKHQNIAINELLEKIAGSNLFPKEIALRKSLDRANPQVSADPVELRRALDAVLTNAAEAMPQGGTATFKTFLDGELVCLEIGDTGSGVSKDAEPKMFQPFFTTKERHVGLGLATAKKIISRHQGKAGFSSSASGTIIRLWLPKAR